MVGGGELERLGQLGDLRDGAREPRWSGSTGLETPGFALLIDDGVDGGGEAGEQAHAETVAEAAEGVAVRRSS